MDCTIDLYYRSISFHNYEVEEFVGLMFCIYNFYYENNVNDLLMNEIQILIIAHKKSKWLLQAMIEEYLMTTSKTL